MERHLITSLDLNLESDFLLCWSGQPVLGSYRKGAGTRRFSNGSNQNNIIVRMHRGDVPVQGGVKVDQCGEGKGNR
jgi:hypothetical protein